MRKEDTTPKKVIFVIGAPCSGKTHFIREHYPEAKVIDLWDYQKEEPFLTLPVVIESYRKAKEAVTEAIQSAEEDIVVLEHTMLRAKRRAEYIEAVKKYDGVTLLCYAIMPDDKTHRRYCESRECRYGHIKAARDIFEIPKVEEGFDEVYIIEE